MESNPRPMFTRVGPGVLVAPRPHLDWEAGGAFAPAVVKTDAGYYMLYRAFGRDKVSRLGVGRSDDGLRWHRSTTPLLYPDDDTEAWGMEDPRLVMCDNQYMVSYTAASGHEESDGWHWTTRVRFAVSKNGHDYTRITPELPPIDNKDAALFPAKINGNYWLIHRFMPDMWVSSSPDLITWSDHRRILTPVAGSWQSSRIGAGSPPILTPLGWLVFHHGVAKDLTYSMSALVLDASDPTKVLYRLPYPLLVPELPYELKGYVPNVVFGTGVTDEGESYRLYYGGADFVIAAAEINKEQLLAALSAYPAETAPAREVPLEHSEVARPALPVVTLEEVGAEIGVTISPGEAD